MCQECNTTIIYILFAVFVASLSSTHTVKCSVFYINICSFLHNHISLRVSQYLSNSNSVVFTRLGLSAVRWAVTVFFITSCVLYDFIDLWGNWYKLHWFLLIFIAVNLCTSPPLCYPEALKQIPVLKLYFTEREFKRNVKNCKLIGYTTH